MIVLDASVVIASLDSGDVHHEPALDLLADAADADFLVHPLTMAEVLVEPCRRGLATDLLHGLEVGGVRVDMPDAGQPLRLAQLRTETSLKLPDCCVLDIALLHRAPLATFDERLAAAAATKGVETLPAR